MRIGLRTTILALILASGLPPAGDVVSARRHVRTVPLTMASTERLRAPGTVHLATPPTHVAFSWRGSPSTGVEYRMGGGRWQRVPEAHDMEAGNKHFSALITVDRPDAIQWRPVRPRGAWMGKVTLDHLNTVDGPRVAARAETSTTETAGPKAPNIVTRAEWGADESIKRTGGSCDRDFYPVQQLFVHHTAGSNFDPSPRATMRAIYWYHTIRRGWCDIGYNFVIARDGTIYEGRWARNYKPWEAHTSEDRSGRAVAGAHVSSFNSGSVGISLMGNYDTAPVPPDMRRSLAELLAWEVDRHDLSPFGAHTYRNPETGLSRRLPFIAGHRDAGQTACPGKNVYFSMKEIRRDTKAVIGAGKNNTTLNLMEPSVVVDYGGSASLTGSLIDEHGARLAGRTITLYQRIKSQGWRVQATAVTGADGSFLFDLEPTANARVQAVYEGDASTWGAQSAPMAVKVRHVLTLSIQGLSPDANGAYHIPQSAPSVTFAGTLVPAHDGREVEIAISRANADGTYVDVAGAVAIADSAGSFTYTFVRPDVGTAATYVATATLGRDKQHAFGASDPVTFVAE